MAVLLLAEVNNGELAMDATAKTVTAAKSLGDVTVLCAGGSAAAAGESAAKIDGVSKVLVAEDATLGHRLAESTAALIVSLAGDYEHIVAPATTDAKNVMPRVAALLDVMIISDASGVVDGDTFERPIYAGNAVQTVKSKDAKKVITFAHRPSMRRDRRLCFGRDGGRSGLDPRPFRSWGPKTRLPPATAPS
jgi:Electron transfer flavoprotein, alpha subunit